MSGRTKLILAAVIVLTGGLALSRLVQTGMDRATPPPAEYFPPGPVPDFTLTESHGQPVTRADLLGKIWVADLMFTACGNTCPMLSATMSSLDRALGPRDDVRLVSISVTPEYDQPEVLRAYAQTFHASDKWLFLTGERAQIVHLANTGFWLSAGSPGTVTHSDKFVLVDRTGKVRGFFDGTKSASVPQLQEAIEKLDRKAANP
ncbi:MAG: SCO family protein [Chthoniobacter sp.]|nr:SCO family protein [Chthoniobacter sp.]